MKTSAKIIAPDSYKCRPWINTGPEIAHLDFWQFAIGKASAPQLVSNPPRSLNNIFGMRWGQDGII